MTKQKLSFPEVETGENQTLLPQQQTEQMQIQEADKQNLVHLSHKNHTKEYR